MTDIAQSNHEGTGLTERQGGFPFKRAHKWGQKPPLH